MKIFHFVRRHQIFDVKIYATVNAYSFATISNIDNNLWEFSYFNDAHTKSKHPRKIVVNRSFMRWDFMGFSLIENCGCGNEFACSAKILRWFLLRALKLNFNRRFVELTEQFSSLSFSSCSSPKLVIFVLPKLKLKWSKINRLYIKCNRIWNINSEYVENFTFSYDLNACSMFTRIVDSDETEINCCSRS